MKKILPYLMLCVGTIELVNAQILSAENFESLTVGNICTATDGTTVGQGGYYALNGTTTDYQIVDEGTAIGKILQMNGPNVASPPTFNLFKNDLPALWSTRTVGNNIIEIEVDLYTGGATTSKNVQILFLYDATGSKVLVGFAFVPETKELLGSANYSNAGAINNYTFYLASGGLYMPPNSWVRIGMSYNKTNGLVLWKAPGMASASGVLGAAAGTDPNQLKFIIDSFTGNTLSFPCKWNDLSVKATNTSTLLSEESFTLLESNVVLFPNPTSGEVTLTTNYNNDITKILITDCNGRIIKVLNGHVEKIDFSNFLAGIYFVAIETPSSKEVRKIIKR